MSIFTKALKTFTTNITGDPVELKINNRVWVLLKSKFDLTQSEYQEQAQLETNVYAAKFITCVFIANGHVVTEEEVNDGIDEVDVFKFIKDYNSVLYKKGNEVLSDGEEEEGK